MKSKTYKPIISLSADEARNVFLLPENYFSLMLPPYFDFSKVIESATNKLEGKKLSDFYSNSCKPQRLDNINFTFLCNKNGQYSWRPFTIIHPMFYVELANLITEEKNWSFLQSKFSEFKSNKKIVCVSDPVYDEKRNSKVASVFNWYDKFEQQSLRLAIEFEYMAKTDIADCYSSIYTHSIPWALYGKEYAKQHTADSLLGNHLDKTFQKMSYNQTNGIPQGNMISDFIAEIVLGYSDSLLSEQLKTQNIKDYKILRYRDDYRIFVNEISVGDRILKCLSEILSDLNMKFNSSKTSITDDIITNSIKPDKLYWKSRTVAYDKIKLQDKLLEIYELGKLHPNSGSVEKALNELYKVKISKSKNKPANLGVILSIIVEIMYKNPRTYPICSAIIAKLLEGKTGKKLKANIQKILQKFSKIPNTAYLELYLQRAILPYNESVAFTTRIAQKVNDNSISIWNSDWVDGGFQEDGIIDKAKLNNLPKTIGITEVNSFDIYN